MALDAQKLKTVKEGIDKKSITHFYEIFFTLSKGDIAIEIQINKGRFRELVDDPSPLRMSEIYRIAKLLSVQPRQISELIHNQLDTHKHSRTKAK